MYNKTKEKYVLSIDCYLDCYLLLKESVYSVCDPIFFFLLVSLANSRGNVSVYQKSKLTIK